MPHNQAVKNKYIAPDWAEQTEAVQFMQIERSMKALRGELKIMARAIESVIDQVSDMRSRRGEGEPEETKLEHVTDW